jgi:glycosyltransferase involved in cell wall biosynthesis
MRDEVTALILTFNEAPNIERTLGRVCWLSHILVIDSFSDDRTIDLIRRTAPHATIQQRRFDSFAGQCNYGVEQISTEWVLSLDADYVLTDELTSELIHLDPPEDVVGYSAAFRYCIHGYPLRSTVYPPRTVLYRCRQAHYEDEGHGHRVRVSGNVVPLRGYIDHDDRKPLSWWMTAQDKYSKIEARHLLALPGSQLSAQDRVRRRIYFAPALMFFYLLFGRGLILDGWSGWYYVMQRTIAEMLLSLRLLTERENLDPTD